MPHIPSTRSELRELILRAIHVPYLSQSCHGSIETGNHYQSLKLGDLETSGFRTSRTEFLDRIDFRGKRVLDLGSNLGELSRAARARGATLVDGIEYDPYFIEIANLVNAHDGTTRVSFHRGDITDPEIYTEHYDIVLAFSVFTYASSVLDRIAGVTDQALLLETHKLDGNLETSYLAPVRKYFPHYRILGESEWGARLEDREKRAVIVFAKDAALLEATFRPSDSATSRVVEHTPEREEGVRVESLDVCRTCLQQQFFSVFDASSREDLFAAASGLSIDLQAIARLSNSTRDYNGWLYWLLFLRGYLQYAETGKVGLGNIYHDYLTNYYVRNGGDPGMRRRFASADATVERVKQRFLDLDAFKAQADGVAGVHLVAPVRAIISDPPSRNALRIYVSGTTEPLLARRIDGWHRLFSARVCGTNTLPLEVVREEHAADSIQGRVERFSFDGQELEVRGWLLHPEKPIHAVEVRLDGETVAIVDVVRRPDVQKAFPDITHAQRSGFSVRCACAHSAATPAVFQILGLGDWVPVGSLRLNYPRRQPEASQRTPNERDVVACGRI